jgi:hypothetical protein
MFAQHRSSLAQGLGALLRRRVAPERERSACRSDGTIDIVCRRVDGDAERVAGGRAAASDFAPSGRGMPRAAV